jgi:hypothetical protein
LYDTSRNTVFIGVSNVCVTLGEQVTNEVPNGPHEELVAELRARIRELEQRQEWLLREGETLQVGPLKYIIMKFND